MKKFSVLLLLLALPVAGVKAQELTATSGKWPLTITVFSEAWAIPSAQLIKTPIHPGISLGSAYPLRQSPKSSLSLNGTLGYFYHKNIQHNVHVIASLAYQHKIIAGLQAGVGLGIGYSHSVYPTPVYKLKNGEYQRVTDWGKPTALPSLDFNLGYTFNRSQEKPLTVFAKYQFMAEWPYAPENTFPVLPHTLFHVGFTCYPFN